MSAELIIQAAADELSALPFVRAVVLGGSRATGTATVGSDIDIGIYYDAPADFDALCRIAARLDDAHRDNLVCSEGGWGDWVNCGGWLTVDGIAVDLIMRDFNRVSQACADCENGVFSTNYHTGHPHAFLSVIYRGELARCKVLYARDDAFLQLKKQAEIYPELLREAIISFFSFEAGFSCSLAEKAAKNSDLYYLHGHLFRSVSACNQVLFALNRVYCLNEKKAPAQIAQMPLAPENYPERVNQIFSLPPLEAVALLSEICGEVQRLSEAAQG